MSNFKENISKGKKRVFEKCGSAKNAVMDSKPVKWGMGKYNSFNKWTLGLSWMHTYYGDTRENAEKKLRKRFGLNDEEMEAGYRDGFAKVMREKGQENKVKHKAIGRILLRATMAAGVSFVCDIPQIESDWFWLAYNNRRDACYRHRVLPAADVPGYPGVGDFICGLREERV